MELLHMLAPQRITRAELAEYFPGRTLPAIKKKLAEVRRGLGVSRVMSAEPSRQHAGLDPDDPGVEDDWMRRHVADMECSNAAFVAALNTLLKAA